MDGESSEWNAIIARRTSMAEDVRQQLELDFGLNAGVNEPFTASRLDEQFLADLRMWEVPFYAIADRMQKAANGRHVIDHAWWLIADDRDREPWGFVTEPYIEERYGVWLVEQMERHHRRWGVDFRCWPKAKSAWNPGSAVPIVTTILAGGLPEFLFHGVGAALKTMRGRPIISRDDAKRRRYYGGARGGAPGAVDKNLVLRDSMFSFNGLFIIGALEHQNEKI